MQTELNLTRFNLQLEEIDDCKCVVVRSFNNMYVSTEEQKLEEREKGRTERRERERLARII